MGQFATHGGLSKALFRFVGAFLGHLRGRHRDGGDRRVRGLRRDLRLVASPPRRRWGRSRCRNSAASATRARSRPVRSPPGGTLGIMIPPSVPLVIYAILTQESIGKLFMAAVLPGIIAMLGYMLVVKIVVSLEAGGRPRRARASRGPRRLKSLLLRVARAARVPRRDRRHLRRLGEPDRGGGDRRGGLRRDRDRQRRHARKGTRRQRARHRAGHRDDLPGAARRRHAEHDARAVADAGASSPTG